MNNGIVKPKSRNEKSDLNILKFKKESNTFYSLIRKELNLGIKVKSRNVNIEKRNANNNPGFVNSLSSSYNKAVFHQRLNFDMELSEQNDEVIEEYFKSSIKHKIKVVLEDCKIPKNDNISRNNGRNCNKQKNKKLKVLNEIYMENKIPVLEFEGLEEEKINSPKNCKKINSKIEENFDNRIIIKEEIKHCCNTKNHNFNDNLNDVNNIVLFKEKKNYKDLEKEEKFRNFVFNPNLVSSKYIHNSPESYVNASKLNEKSNNKYTSNIKNDDLNIIEKYAFIRHNNKKKLNSKNNLNIIKGKDIINSKNNSNSNSNIKINISNQQINIKEITNNNNIKESSLRNNKNSLEKTEKFKYEKIEKNIFDKKTGFTPKSNLNKTKIKFLPSIKQKLDLLNNDSLSKEKKINYVKTSTNKIALYEVDLNNFYKYNNNNIDDNTTKTPIINIKNKSKILKNSKDIKFANNKFSKINNIKLNINL